MARMQKANLDVREAIKDAKVYQYEVAEELGISEETFSRMLRKELPGATKRKILNTLDAVLLKQENAENKKI